MGRFRDAAVGAGIDAVDETGIGLTQFIERRSAAASEARFLPDLIQPSRIAAIAGENFLPGNAQPTRQPNIYRVVQRERAAGDDGRWLIKEGDGHGSQGLDGCSLTLFKRNIAAK